MAFLKPLGTIITVGGLFLMGSIASAKDTYKVALDGTFAPHAMPKMAGGVEGFNVDLANEIGRQIGRAHV